MDGYNRQAKNETLYPIFFYKVGGIQILTTMMDKGCPALHWRSAHYAGYACAQKIVTFKGGHLMW